jgi:hypothetical protein
LLQASQINPTKSAYEIVNGPNNWNRYPLAPLGCKAVIYNDGNIRGSWASRGVDRWYLGPSQDHYQCDLYFVPETRAYRISGSTELFPQHCQVPNLTQHQHLRALTEELANVTTSAGTTAKGRALIKKLQVKINNILTPQASVATPKAQQRVREDEQRVRAEEQRVIDKTPISTVPRITDAPPIMHAQNPTSKRALKLTPRIHARMTRNNTPGKLLAINRVHPIPNTDAKTDIPTRHISTRKCAGNPTPPTTGHSLPTRAQHRLVTQQAINALTIQEKVEIKA